MVIAIQRPTTPAPAPIDFARLGDQIFGELVLPTDASYEEARRVHDISVDRRPLAVVRAATASDVAAAVAFAGEHDLTLAVRGGGHSTAGYGTADDALVIDVAGMKEIAIDPETRIARVGAGANSGDLAGLAAAHGLALSTGDTASVGFGGLVTGGGIGLMVRRHGLAIDNLLAARVVTADGEIVTASAEEHPDLFWAIRGGGGNFGIITEFTFRLAPVGIVYGGMLFLPASRDVLRGFLDYATAAPDDLSMIANLMHAPPAPFVAPERIGELSLAILFCWTGELADGERALVPLRALGTPIAEAAAPMPYPAIFNFTAVQSAPHASAIRSMFADELSDATLDAALAAMGRATSPFNLVQFRGLGGAMGRVAPEATAFAHRERRYLVAAIAPWMDPAEDGAPHRAWTEALWREIRHEGIGVYANFLEREGADRVRDAYPPATYARLAAAKATYDPRNLFHLNQNIAPAPRA